MHQFKCLVTRLAEFSKQKDNVFTDMCVVYILTLRKVGHFNIKTKMFDFEAHVLIGWQANSLN